MFVKFFPTVVARVLFALLVIGLIYSIAQGWRTERKHAENIEKLAGRYADELVMRQNAEIENERIDRKYRGELNEKINENNRLSDELEHGGRMRIITKEVGVSTTSPATCMGDGAGIQLPRDTGRNLLRIRAGIIKDQAKIKVLQEYIKVLRSQAVINNS